MALRIKGKPAWLLFACGQALGMVYLTLLTSVWRQCSLSTNMFPGGKSPVPAGTCRPGKSWRAASAHHALEGGAWQQQQQMWGSRGR